MATKKKKTVALIVAHDGFQFIEYEHYKKLLEKNGYTVVTASNMHGAARGTYNHQKAHVNLLVNDIRPAEYAGILLIGGLGTLAALDNQTTYRLLKAAQEVETPILASCIATRILAKAGVLKGKIATGWNEDEKLPVFYRRHNGTFRREKVVTDGNLVTSSGLDAMDEFGKHILATLNPKKFSV